MYYKIPVLYTIKGFNLILVSLAGLPWIIALFKAILLGAFSGEHSPNVYQLDRFVSSGNQYYFY